MIVIMDVMVFNDTREIHSLQILAQKQVHSLEIQHAGQ